MHRSGTSCVTGLLVKCGLSLGTSHPLLNVPSRENPKGHFENRGAILLNDTILQHAGGSWCILPPREAVERAGQRFAEHFQRFGETFNGDVLKDPRICLTVGLWRKHCPNVKAAVLCLRNPIAVAGSLKRRNGIPAEIGLRMWYEYNLRFITAAKNLPVFVVDYDNMGRNLQFEFSSLLSELGVELESGEMQRRIGDFYSGGLNHGASDEKHLELLPPDIRNLYEIILSQTYTQRFGHKTAVA